MLVAPILVDRNIFDPKPRLRDKLRVLVLDERRCFGLALAHPVGGFDLHAGGAVIVGLDHLGFIKRQEGALTFDPAITVERKPHLDQLRRVVELLGVVGLMKHSRT